MRANAQMMMGQGTDPGERGRSWVGLRFGAALCELPVCLTEVCGLTTGRAQEDLDIN